MLATIAPLSALFSGVAMLLLGSGLLATLLGVRGTLEGFGDQVLGLIMSAYFLGFFCGTFIAPAAIRRMGHIRSFAFFAAVFTCTVLLHAIWISPLAWGLLRVGTGIAVVALYMVIESWLNASVSGEQRGRVFAVYMAINLVALAIGQQLLRIAPPDSFALFSVVAILVVAAMLPITATRMAQPVLHEAERLGIGRMFRLAPAASVGALVSGLTVGVFWGLGPVYAGRLGLDPDGIAIFMTVTIIGGALLQWPIGRFSDSGDRRRTLAAACLGAALMAGVAMVLVATGVSAQNLVTYQLEHLPPDSKGLVLWILEGSILSSQEVDFLSRLPSLEPRVKVAIEMGGARSFRWKPLKEAIAVA